MRIEPHLTFRGDCEEAFQFYEKVLGGKIEMIQTHGESPMADKVPANWRDAVLHARLKLGDHVLMASDAPPERYHKPEGFHISLQLSKPADADRIFGALAENGSVEMPIQETFWAQRFAMLTDRFGIPWMIDVDKPSS